MYNYVDPVRDWAHPCKDICNRWTIAWACACSKRMVQQQKWRVKDLILRMPKFGAQWQVNEFYFTIFRFSTQAFCKGKYISFSYFFLRHFKGRRTFQAHIKNCPNSAGREVWCEFLRKVKWKHVFEKHYFWGTAEKGTSSTGGVWILNGMAHVMWHSRLQKIKSSSVTFISVVKYRNKVTK